MPHGLCNLSNPASDLCCFAPSFPVYLGKRTRTLTTTWAATVKALFSRKYHFSRSITFLFNGIFHLELGDTRVDTHCTVVEWFDCVERGSTGAQQQRLALGPPNRSIQPCILPTADGNVWKIMQFSMLNSKLGMLTIQIIVWEPNRVAVSWMYSPECILKRCVHMNCIWSVVTETTLIIKRKEEINCVL